MKKILPVLLIAATGLSTFGLAHAQVSTTATGRSLNAATQRPFGDRQQKPYDCVIANISNGITVTLTSTDATKVATLQAKSAEEAKRLASRPGLSNVQTATENVTNGIKVTLTSTDTAMVKLLQTKPAKGGPKDMLENIQVSVEKLSNGVAITRTSTDAAAVTKLQEIEAKMQADKGTTTPDGKPKLEGVTVKVENLSNGVKTTLTSDNAETVAKLQAMPTKMVKKHFPGHRGRGMDKAPAQE